MTEPRQPRLYGRRLGRPLKHDRLDVLETLLPKLEIPAGAYRLDPVALFSRTPQSLWFEIGFGNGEHLAALLERHPDGCYIGAEPFVNGMAAFLKSIRPHPEWHDRIRVVMDDARPVISALPDDALDGIYVLNPDPWPKKRHHKRRIISQENLDVFARVLKPGGQLVMTTDVDDLAEWMVTEASRHPAFAWTAESAADWKNPPPDWIETRYEAKGAQAGRVQTYLIFRKISSDPAKNTKIP
jgi:tRNA (guanine-N7-)-methyltransferase